MNYNEIVLDKNVNLNNSYVKKSIDNLIKILNENKHELISAYKSVNEKVLIDFKCIHEPQWVYLYDYKRRARCPSCHYKNTPESSKENLIKLIHHNKHELLSEYVKAFKKVQIDFKCGHEPHWITPHDYKKNIGCPKCAKQCPIQAKENFINQIKKNKHDLLSEYVKVSEKVQIDFKCGHEPHWITPSRYKLGQCCPRCKQSKGVKSICEWLTKNNIKYWLEYTLPNKTWRYDIYIPKHKTVVEVHGMQHYKESYFNTKKKRTLEFEKENDKKKKEYAIANGLKYIEVDYREHEPYLALKRFIKAFKSPPH